MEYIKEQLFNLSALCFAGAVKEAQAYAESELSKYAEVKRIGNSTVGYMGKGDYTLMLAAHIDEVSFTVTDIDDRGFITVSACGGIDLRHLPSRRVIIHAKEKVRAVFCSVPPHLKKNDAAFEDIKNFKIDSLLGEKAKDIISLGDIVTFDETPKELLGDYVTGKALDNRAGVVCLLKTARRLKEREKELPFKVAFCFTDAEELGLRGAKTAAFGISPDEALAVDVTFGDAPDVDANECKKLGSGAAIGISPGLSREISEKLIKSAKEKNILYSTEIMGARTGTDGDVIAVSGSGVKTCTVSVPLRNMHTPAETVKLSDLSAVSELLCAYILSGGIKND